MRDAGDSLRVAYSELLQDLTYKGNLVSIYALIAPNDAKAPYVIIGPWIQQSDNTKYDLGQQGDIAIDVVTRFVGGDIDTIPASEIAQAISERLQPTTVSYVLNVPGFNCWKTIISAMRDIVLNTSTDIIVRKLITVSHSLEEL